METLLANLAPVHQAEEERTEYTTRMDAVFFPLGLGLIASALKSHGCSFSTYDSYVDGSLQGFLEVVERRRPGVVMMSGFFGNKQYPFVEGVLRRVKETSPSTCIILGGPMATTIPHLLAQHTEVDYIVVGEGESTIVELMDTIRSGRTASDVPGVFLGREHGGRYVGPRDRIRKLHQWPDYDAFPIQKYIDDLNRSGKGWEISTSRGCWANCQFCKITFGQKITSYPMPHLVRHMREVVERYGVTRFSFVDDNFLNASARVKEFLSLLRSDCPPVAWRFQGRADAIRPGDVQEMIGLGLYDITFGLESGSQAMLDRYRKKLDLRKAVANLLEIRDMLDFHATFVLGGPGENWETVAETESLIRTLRLGGGYIGILTLLPGSGLYEDACRTGVIADEDAYCRSIGAIFEHVYTNMSDLSDAELVTARDRLTGAARAYRESA